MSQYIFVCASYKTSREITKTNSQRAKRTGKSVTTCKKYVTNFEIWKVDKKDTKFNRQKKVET